ncbi:MAG: sugar phosphate isomerase/epimerase [Armatimonadetes bacterium]|nr:sugar phosphate isomerase/epimerase [Armatimonadota bacterium]
MKLTAIIHAMTCHGEDTVPFDEGLRTLRRAGFEGVMLMSRPGGPVLREGEIPDACLIDLAASDLGAIRRLADEADIEITSVFGSGVDVSDDEAMERTVENLTGVVEIGKTLGCSFMGHPCPRAEATGMSTSDKREIIDRLLSCIDAVAAAAPEIRFGVDVHYHGSIESVADCRYYVEQAEHDNVGILLNTGHMTTTGQPGWELLETIPERVFIIGWKDHLTGPDLERPVVSVELGTGHTDFGKYIERLKGDPTQRLHLINVEDAPIPEKETALRASREYLQGLWAR